MLFLPQGTDSNFDKLRFPPQGHVVSSVEENGISRITQTISVRTTDTSHDTNSERYLLFGIGQAFSSASRLVIPADCHLKRLKITLDTAPGTDNDYEYEIYTTGCLDSLNQVMSGKIENDETELDSETLNAFYPTGLFLPKGTLLELHITPTGTPSTYTNFELEYDFKPVTNNTYFVFAQTQTEATITAEERGIPFANQTSLSGTSSKFNKKIGCAGVFSNWHALKLSTQTGANVMEMRLKNTSESTEYQLDQTSSPDYTRGVKYVYVNDTDTLTVGEGDVIEYSHTPVNSPTSGAVINAWVFTPTTPEDNFYNCGSLKDLSISAVEYNYLTAGGYGNTALEEWTTTQADREIVWPYNETLSDFRSELEASVGGSGGTLSIVNQTAIDAARAGTNQVDLVYGTSDVSVDDTSSEMTILKDDRMVLKSDFTSAATPRYLGALTFKGTRTTAISAQDPDSRITNDTVLGAVKDTSVKVSAHLNENRNTQLVISTTGTRAGFDADIVVTTSLKEPTGYDIKRADGTSATTYVVEHEATGLTADTDYHYAIRAGGVTDLDSIRSFKTYYTEYAEVGATVTDRYLFGSCSDMITGGTGLTNNRIPIFSTLSTLARIRLFLHQGDFTYHNNEENDEPLVNAYIMTHRTCPDLMKLTSHYNFIHTPSDHDACSSDGNNETANASVFVPVNYMPLRNFFPKYNYPTGSAPSTWIQGVSQSFVDGKVGFIILDTQYQRHPTDSTMIGDGSTTTNHDGDNYTTFDQLGWMQTTATTMKAAGVKYLFVALGGSKIGTGTGGDEWKDDPFLDEWKAINDFFCDPTNDVPEIAYLYGDTHNIGADDGAVHCKFATQSGQIACFRAAPFRSSIADGTSFGDTWNGTGRNVAPTDGQTGGVIEVTKNPALHEYGITFIALNVDGTTNQSVSKSDATRTIEWNATTSAPATTGTHSITLDKSWLGAGQATLTLTGTMTIGDDYTLADSMGNEITGNGTITTHPNSDTTNYIVTMIGTRSPGETIILTLSSPDSGSTLGSNTVHTATVA